MGSSDIFRIKTSSVYYDSMSSNKQQWVCSFDSRLSRWSQSRRSAPPTFPKRVSLDHIQGGFCKSIFWISKLKRQVWLTQPAASAAGSAGLDLLAHLVGVKDASFADVIQDPWDENVWSLRIWPVELSPEDLDLLEDGGHVDSWPRVGDQIVNCVLEVVQGNGSHDSSNGAQKGHVKPNSHSWVVAYQV